MKSNLYYSDLNFLCKFILKPGQLGGSGFCHEGDISFSSSSQWLVLPKESDSLVDK